MTSENPERQYMDMILPVKFTNQDLYDIFTETLSCINLCPAKN